MTDPSLVEKGVRDARLSRTNVFEWYGLFCDGQESVEDGPEVGRPHTSTPAEKLKYYSVVFYFGNRLLVDDPNTGRETPYGQRNGL